MVKPARRGRRPMNFRLLLYGRDLGHPGIRQRECMKRRNRRLPFLFWISTRSSRLSLLRPMHKIGESRRRVERVATTDRIQARWAQPAGADACASARAGAGIPTFAAETPLVHRETVLLLGRSGMAASRAAEVAGSSVDRVIDDSTAVALPARFHLSLSLSRPTWRSRVGEISRQARLLIEQREQVQKATNETRIKLSRDDTAALSGYRSSCGDPGLLTLPAQDTHPTLDLILLDAARAVRNSTQALRTRDRRVWCLEAGGPAAQTY
ncbi:hypothetical protein DFH06DRAFT_1303534 [Mycena polygramma]|nr:hypothetical protein DFH06DRAFT_1303534 [Mycena polygramma]